MSLTFIKDHGEWSAYVPSPYPENFPQGVMFTKRASDSADSIDWYAYKETQFQADTIKIVIVPDGDQWIAQAASREQQRLFPQGGAKVVEFSDGNGFGHVEPDAYTGKVYDPVSHTLSDPEPTIVKLKASARQIRLALNTLELRDAIETYVASQGIEVKDSWEFTTEFEEDHPLIQAGQAALGITNEQVHDIFALAVTL